MKRFLYGLIAFALAVSPAGSGNMTLLGAGKPSGAAYQGPGDIVSGALIWGSCARVYNASLASTSTSLCDLVDTTAGSTAVCTLRGSSTGFVDLTNTYCTGSLTPSAACAAASGGACRVSKVYDQIGGTGGWSNGTNSQRPVLTFSAQNGLPGLTGTAAANTSLTSAATITRAQPYTNVGVAKRTSNFTTQQAVIGSSGTLNNCLSFTSTANTGGWTNDGATTITTTATDSSFNALQGVADTTPNAVVSIDGSATTGNAGGTSGYSSNTSRIMRCAGGISMDGVFLEGGLWPSGFNNTQRGDMNTNIHSAIVGYNF